MHAAFKKGSVGDDGVKFLSRSALYDCRVVHARLWPRVHRLAYRLFWFALDLDDVEKLPRSGLVGRGPLCLYRFRAQDHLCFPGPEEQPLKQKLSDYLRQQFIKWDGSRALLVTQLRFLGYVFNPVSFFFCWNTDGSPAAVVAEVGNTFGEMKLYALGPDSLLGGVFKRRVPKHFYVSPFTDLLTEFEFRLAPPGARLLLDVDDYKEGQRILVATLQGRRRALSRANLVWATLRFPAVTLQIIFLIHFNALLLWVKRVPYFAKRSGKQEQRNVLRRAKGWKP